MRSPTSRRASACRYVNQRWLGGMLHQLLDRLKRLQRLKELEVLEQTGGTHVLTKKEALVLSARRRSSSARSAASATCRSCRARSGSSTPRRSTSRSPRRKKLGIPVVAILDTNCDPDEVDYPIPGNDDAIRSVQTLTRVVADAVADGLIARAGAAVGEDKPDAASPGTVEPLAEWERRAASKARPRPSPRPRARASPPPRPRASPGGSARDRGES